MGNSQTSCPDLGPRIPTTQANNLSSLILTILAWIVVAIALPIHIYKRKRFVDGRSRDLIVLITLSIAFTWSLNLRMIIGKDDFPCVLLWSYTLVVFFWVSWPVVVRAILFYTRIKLNRVLAERAFTHFLEESMEAQSSGANFETGPSTRQLKRFSRDARKKKSTPATAVAHGDAREGSLSIESQGAISASDYSNMRSSGTPDVNMVGVESSVRRAKYLASYQFGFIITAIPIFLATLFFLVRSRGYYGCVGCTGPSNSLLGSMIAFGLVMIATSLYIFWMLRAEPDPLKIKKELVIVMVTLAFSTVGWFIIQFIDPNDADGQGKINYWLFVLPFHLIVVITMLFPSIFIKTSLALSDASKIDDQEVPFKKVMESNIGRQLFKAHMAHELNIENYYFWREAIKWRDTFSDQTEERRLLRFRFLVETFIESGSMLEINVGGDYVEAVEEVTHGRKPLSEDVFDDCIREVYQLMVFHSWPRFQSTNMYRQGILHVRLGESDLSV